MIRPVNPFKSLTTHLKSEKIEVGNKKSSLNKRTNALAESLLTKDKKYNSPKR